MLIAALALLTHYKGIMTYSSFRVIDAVDALFGLRETQVRRTKLGITVFLFI